MDWDSRTILKKVEDWLRKHGWWLFSTGIVFNLALLFCIFGTVGESDPNVLSVSLTILEIFIVVVAFGGFWMIRGAAITAARSGARDEVRRLYEEGYLSSGAKRDMLVSTTGPEKPPDLSNAVPETAEEDGRRGSADADGIG